MQQTWKPRSIGCASPVGKQPEGGKNTYTQAGESQVEPVAALITTFNTSGSETTYQSNKSQGKE